jgi:hypothetical protein
MAHTETGAIVAGVLAVITIVSGLIAKELIKTAY